MKAIIVDTDFTRLNRTKSLIKDIYADTQNHHPERICEITVQYSSEDTIHWLEQWNAQNRFSYDIVILDYEDGKAESVIRNLEDHKFPLSKCIIILDYKVGREKEFQQGIRLVTPEYTPMSVHGQLRVAIGDILMTVPEERTRLSRSRAR